MNIKCLTLLMVFLVATSSKWACEAQITYQCSLSNLTFSYQDTLISGNTYRFYEANGLKSTIVPGYPYLPMKLLKFSVPYNATNIAVEVIGSSYNTSTPQPFIIAPVPQRHMLTDTLAIQYLPDPVAYSANSFYPTKAAELLGEGVFMGENRLVTIGVYPMQWNPVSGKIRRINSVNLKITYDLLQITPNDLYIRDDIDLRQQAWDEMKNFVANPTQVESFAPTGTTIHQIQGMLIPDSLLTEINDSTANYGGELGTVIDSTPREYLIITTRNLEHSLRRLAALKRQKGYSVGIRCIEDIVSDPYMQCGDSISCAAYPIKDDAGKLRQYLRYSQTMNRTKFVMFAGNGLPFRYSHVNGSVVPTDHYYSDLTTNWNINNNSNYGESSVYWGSHIHKFDIYPELFVGRLFADSESDIDNYTNKLLRYELNPGKGNYAYLSRAFINQGFKDSWAVNLLPLILPNFTSLFTNTTVISRLDNSYPTGTDIIHDINANQYGFLAIHGHGNYNCVNVNNELGSFIKTLDRLKTIPHTMGLDSLDNKYSPSVFYSMSCSTIPYDSTQFNMGQSFTIGADYGGVAFLGNTRSGYASAVNKLGGAFELEDSFYQSLKSGLYKVSHAESYSKTNTYKLNGSFYDEVVHNLIGDPEFDIWTDSPQAYNNITVQATDDDIIVQNLVQGDTVAYCSNNSQGRIVATSSSVVLGNVNPNSTVLVYKHNRLPYIAPLVLQNTQIHYSQYVIASDVIAGNHVDSGRTAGDVVIPSGVDYEIEHKGSVILAPGFKVEKGAKVSIIQSDY